MTYGYFHPRGHLVEYPFERKSSRSWQTLHQTHSSWLSKKPTRSRDPPSRKCRAVGVTSKSSRRKMLTFATHSNVRNERRQQEEQAVHTTVDSVQQHTSSTYYGNSSWCAENFNLLNIKSIAICTPYPAELRQEADGRWSPLHENSVE